MVRYLKFVASGVGWAVALFVLAVPASAQSAATPEATSHVNSRPSANVDGAAITAAARTLAPYLVRNLDGTLRLEAPPAVLNRLPSNSVQQLTAGLGVLNVKLAAGELQTTAAGAVFDPKADRLLLQGGWTGHGYTWWGQYWCISHGDLRALNNWATTGGNWLLTSAILGLIAAIPGTSGLVAVFMATYGWWMISVDYGNGSCLNGSWAGGPLWVTSQ